jgi:hypothetical protein
MRRSSQIPPPLSIHLWIACLDCLPRLGSVGWRSIKALFKVLYYLALLAAVVFLLWLGFFI